jgi:hypothetical protein
VLGRKTTGVRTGEVDEGDRGTAPFDSTIGKKTAQALSLGAVAAGVRDEEARRRRPRPFRLTTDHPFGLAVTESLPGRGLSVTEGVE